MRLQDWPFPSFTFVLTSYGVVPLNSQHSNESTVREDSDSVSESDSSSYPDFDSDIKESGAPWSIPISPRPWADEEAMSIFAGALDTIRQLRGCADPFPHLIHSVPSWQPPLPHAESKHSLQHRSPLRAGIIALVKRSKSDAGALSTA